MLEVQDLHVRSDRGLPAVRGASFSIAAGEILGIAGVAGNGQRELVEALAGLRPVEKGRVLLNGEDVTNRPPRALVQRGVCYVPGERLVGTVPNLSVAENLILKTYDQAPVCRGIFLDSQAIASHADALIERYAVATPSRETPLKLLSGGNIQRAILARETSSKPSLLIAAHPTSGLDVGATEYIRQVLMSQREEGTAVLLVSEDLEEILQLSDRIAVMYNGEIMGILPADRADLETLGMMMAGIHRIS